jgi:orotate phosphoribosyltransferase
MFEMSFLNIENQFGKPDVPVFATGAIGIGILVAESLGYFVYVFLEAKKHRRQNQVEGFLQRDKM